MYSPSTIRVADQSRYLFDVYECQTASAAYKPSLSLAFVASGTLQGASNNAGGGAINPLVPLAGAAGGLTNSLTNGFDLMNKQRNNVFKHCLQDELRIDHSAIVSNPDDN